MKFRALLAAVLALGLARPAQAQTTPPPDLAIASLEDLMNIEVTSASRKEQRAADVAAAVFVITRDDIRRSGMTTIPDLLRLAPGVDVAQINSNKWAVSIRGFNGLYANKLLVLVDGRSVYTRLFSGVLWDAEDPMLDDIDRIEVIRGPGAAIWGANAVNGVINIVTRGAADTQGGLIRADGGRFGEQAAVRYGGTVGPAHYRLYAQWTDRNQSLIAPGTRADDASRDITTGFRADWTKPLGVMMIEGNVKAGQSHALWPNLDPQTTAREPLATDPSDTSGGDLLARWTHTRPSGATVQMQSFVDFANRREPVGTYQRHAVDLDGQYHTPLGAHQDLVAGAGFRYLDVGFVGHVGFSLTPPQDRATLLTAFIQDEIALFGNRLAVTLGSQMQYDSDFGAGVQPTARVMWKALPHQRLWAATSRAMRTPSLTDRGVRVDYPPVPSAGGLPLVLSLTGDPAAATEQFVDAEAGYRLEIGATASIDVTGYVGRYANLQTTEVADPVVAFVPSPRISVVSQYGNQLDATTHGLEAAGHWTPTPAWRLDASYTAFHLNPHLAAASRDPTAAQADGSAPRTQWQVRSTYSPSARATLDVAIFRVGRLEQSQIDGYTRADVNVEWRFTNHVSVMAIGQNLFDAAHAEFSSTTSLLLATQVPRSVNVRVTWRH